jgi:alkylation response protein AidB-like acyl-CoA dehydrogenase
VYFASNDTMDFSLNDHQKLTRDTVRQFMENEVRPSVRQRDREGRFPIDEIKKLAELGCCGMLVPEEWGGPGLDTVSYVVMLEEVARVDTAMATSVGVTNSAVQVPLLAFGTEAQRKKYLRRLASGTILGSFCLTEPQAGSDAAGIQTRAVRDGADGGYQLNGTKTWVSNGSVAGVFLVFAKTDPNVGGKGITAFLVEPNFQGFRVGRHEEKMGQHASPSVEIILNDCEVPAENRLGEEGQGLKIALSALDGGRIGIAAQAVGLAQGALEEAVKYAKQRRAFG